MKNGQYANASSLADLKSARIGVQVNTTAQTDVETQINPTQAVSPFPNTTLATQALKNGQIDAFVTDLPTTIYLRDAVVSGSTVVGQFPPSTVGFRVGSGPAEEQPARGVASTRLSSR